MALVQPHEVFLSHSSQDRGFVDRLAGTLVRHGVPVWYSRANLLGAQQWQDEIGAALQRCDWFAVVLSRHSVESMWVKREVSKALQLRRFEDRLVPILIERCDYEQLNWTLSLFHIVDFTGSDEDGLRNLLRVWGRGYDGRD
jgi:hypothetical protein